MSVTITVNGSSPPSTVKFQRGSLTIDGELGSRSVCNFELADTAGTYTPQAGQSVVIQEDGVTKFAGTIDDPHSYKIPGSITKVWNIACVNNAQKADKRTYNASHTSQTCGYIVKDMITNVLSEEGITEGNIQDGPTLTTARFPHVYCSQALNELAERAGFSWRINDDNSLDFFDNATFTADAITADSDILAEGIETWTDRSEYRNVQILKNVKNVTALQTETPTPKPDGVSRAFNVNFAIHSKPTIEIDTGGGYVAVDSDDIGILGLDIDKKWYWAKGSTQVSQDASETALSTELIRLKYYGEYTTDIVMDDPAKIAERKAIETGTSGKYEHVETASDIEDIDAGYDKAIAMIRKYGRIARKITIPSDTINFQIGEIRNVTLSAFGIDGEYLVMGVSISDPLRADEKLRKTATLIDGEAVGGWVQFFQKWLESTNKSINENDTVNYQSKVSEDDMEDIEDSASGTTARPPFIFDSDTNIVWGRWQWLNTNYFYIGNGQLAEFYGEE